jgi:type VI secretion system secreted protein VgrG
MRGAYTGGARVALEYRNEFACIPADLPFRPQRRTPRPLMHGTQTAVVVGPAGEEVFTDKHGRVKVHFPWDHEGKKDADSSCWVRVGSVWAGKQWGMIHVPRIGQEVIVSFEEGDPDRPIVVGSVYNADQTPPYKLPDHKTQSGLRTRSSLKGAAANFNELRFEDKKDQEEIYFHAEKNFNRVVENNDTLKVGSKDASDGSQTVEIWKDRTTTLETGNEMITLKKGNRTKTLEKGDETVELKAGKRTHKVKADDVLEVGGAQTLTVTGDRKVTLKMGSQTTKAEAGAVNLEGTLAIELKVGSNSIKIDPSGVTITAAQITLQAQGTIRLSAPNLQLG